MRSNVSIIVFLLASLLISDVFSANILKKSSNVRMVQMLEKLEFNSHFGKTLITAVQLKLKTGSIDEVYTLLDELVAGIQEQQAEHDQEYETNNAEWNAAIQTYTDNLSSLNDDLNTQTTNLANYQAEEIAHQEAYDNLVAVGQELSTQYETLNDWWVAFTDSYNTRQAERQRVLDALDTIIAMLTEKYNAGAFIQLKDLVSTLKAVKAQKNPILSLVHLTLSFNPATVKNVIDRLTAIRDSVSQGASEDSEYYQESKDSYQVQNAALEQQISENTDSQNTETVTLANLRNQIADTQARIDSDNAEIANNESLLAATQDAQTTFNTKYDSDTAERNDEIAVIQHVQEILQNNDSNLRVNDE
jgi:hypothetical protein